MNNEHKEPDNLEIKSVNQQTVDSVILADDERQAISISSTSLNESLDELFDRMRHSIPGKRLFQRKSRLNGIWKYIKGILIFKFYLILNIYICLNYNDSI